MTTRARSPRRYLPDHWLVLPVIALGLLGITMVQSTTAVPATLRPSQFTAEATRHALYFGVGLAVLLAASRVDDQLLRRVAPALYLAAMALLVLVLVTGTSEYGARRWLSLGPMTYQPSELAKLALVVAGAALTADREPRVRALLAWGALLVGPAMLVLVEPDLGTTLVITAAWVAMAVAWGLPWRLFAGIAVAALAVIPLAFTIAVPDYQRERIAVFVNPDRDPLGSGFTLRQVEVALGGGGWTGTGLVGGASSALDGLATRTSDFAFAQAGEAVGLIGALAVIALFALVTWRGIRTAAAAPDAFGRMLALGLTATIAAQALLHIAVNLRFFPATGVALPFVSTGGSAIVTMCAAIGLLQAIATRRPPTPREQWAGERWR